MNRFLRIVSRQHAFPLDYCVWVCVCAAKRHGHNLPIGIRPGGRYPSRRSRHHPGFNLNCAGGECNLRQFVQAGSRGHHIVEQGDPPAGHAGITGKGPLDVFKPCVMGQTGLCRGVAQAPGRIEEHGDSECARQRSGDFQGLIKAAFAEPLRVQWHGQDQLGRAVGYMRGQVGGEEAGQVKILAIFEVLDEAVEGWAVQEAGPRVREGGRMAQARATGCALRGRTRALWTVRRGKPGKVGQTARAEGRTKGACTTKRARLRQP